MGTVRVRSQPPSAYEEAIGAALERLLGDGIADLDGLCTGLDEAAVKDPAGKPWQPEALAAFLASLP